MFRSVEYTGFGTRPDLRRLAERGTATLGGEIRDLYDAVRVRWEPAGDDLRLSLDLELPHVSAAADGVIRSADFDSPDTGLLPSRLRRVWVRVLDDYVDKRRPVWRELSRQPVEV